MSVEYIYFVQSGTRDFLQVCTAIIMYVHIHILCMQKILRLLIRIFAALAGFFLILLDCVAACITYSLLYYTATFFAFSSFAVFNAIVSFQQSSTAWELFILLPV